MFRSYALDGNPEPELVHATGCKQPTLRYKMLFGNPMERTVVKYGYELDNDNEVDPKKIIGD
jgi:hypothetical protein